MITMDLNSHHRQILDLIYDMHECTTISSKVELLKQLIPDFEYTLSGEEDDDYIYSLEIVYMDAINLMKDSYKVSPSILPNKEN
jgi:hypothetical protein